MPLLERIITIVAPHNCLVCGKEGQLLCVFCTPDAFSPLPSRCYSCQVSTENSQVCLKCRKHSPLRHVWVGSEYEGTTKELVQEYKFKHSRAAASVIADLLAQKLPFFPKVMVVPVPTATSRVRQRGFDHANYLAKELGIKINQRYLQALSRIGQTRQLGTKRNERKKQMLGAFRAKNKDLIKGSHILLVDDVVTTGATLEEAARTLRKAGANRIDAVVFAQK